ncbi:MAG: carboxylesterase family protein, partial [Thermoanaerobaculia bacterium]
IHLALAHPDRFAALAVVCGGLLPHPTTTAVARSPLIPEYAEPYSFVAQSLPKVPIWLFHGAGDTVIPPEESRRLYEELKKAGANVRYTEYPGVGHNAWEKAYGEPDFFRWMLAPS